MNDTPPRDGSRLDDLLADRAIFGLGPDESRELERLLAQTGQAGHHDAYDLAAAAVAAAETVADAPMPEALRNRVIADHFAAKTSPHAPPPSRGQITRPRFSPEMRLAGVVAAIAAGLLITLRIEPPQQVTPEQLIANARTALIAEAEDLVRIAWAPQQDAAVEPDREGEAPHGDVVWSDASQTGYLRLRGLRVNDPAREQYQLWVFDEARVADYPVDGGVFDVTSTGEVLVPINTKLPVERATLFAITVEKPGGVVVSDRSRLPLLAKR